MDITKTPVDIKTLIQTSSIEIYDKTKLIEKLQNHFTDEEQRLYVCNLFLYLNYHPVNDFIVNLDNVWKFIGFSNKANAKRLLKHNFKEDIDYKIVFIRSDENPNIKNLGGRPDETIMLNINTFKKLCLKANTENADKIHDYYIKLEMVYNELTKEEIEQQKLLQEEIKNQLKEKDEQLIEQNEEIKKTKEESLLHKHNIILKEYGTTNIGIVYIIKVKTFDDSKYVLKIGESRIGLLSRYKEHKSKYPESIIIECFTVKNSKSFEKFLHNKLSNWRYNKLKDHENENELFLVGEELTYNYIEKLIKDNIQKYNDDAYEIEKLKLEIEKLKLENENLKNDSSFKTTEIIKEIKDLKESIKDEFEKINIITNTKITNNFGERYHALGQKVQQINPDTLNLIKVYNCVAEASRILRIPRSSLVKAINNKTIYKNFRWAYVSENCDENTVKIDPTVELSKVQNNGYIAKLNKEKTEILNLYLDRRTASILNNYDSISYLDNYVKSGKPVGEYYYTLYEKCDEELKKKFIEKIQTEPVLYKNGIGQYDKDHNLIKEFKSKLDCQNMCIIGNKSLTKALSNNKLYNGYYYKYLDKKLFI